jgi:hypothetical protein
LGVGRYGVVLQQKDAFKEYRQQWNVNLGGVFDYLLNSPAMCQLIDLEFNVYHYHEYSSGNPGHRLVWLRLMLYSLIQQAVR